MAAEKRGAAAAKRRKAAAPKRIAKPPAAATAEPTGSMLAQIADLAESMATGAVELARAGSTIPLMLTDNWLTAAWRKSLDPERLEAMTEAGRFLRDAREVAGLNLRDLATAVGLRDTELLEEVEAGRATLPFTMILRIASLVARHDPLPFILQFVRTYNPAMEHSLEELGLNELPRYYERERRFVNVYRKHDILREFDDEHFRLFLDYVDGAVDFIVALVEDNAERDTDRHPTGVRRQKRQQR